ncbi:MAG: threonine ammonia-lyase IlvA [Flavobacteriaceae bacterium]|nr:threonine ammonia-lyase IlvA [Flavobacteriaceae bacterium]
MKFLVKQKQTDYFPDLGDVEQAAQVLKGVSQETPLMHNFFLSEKFDANVLLKREDLQVVRSYKIRGAYNKIRSLNEEEQSRGVVCASAGNHAQGVAYSCYKLGIQGHIYMPATTPKQKIQQVKMFGKDAVKIVLEGDTYDDASKLAHHFCEVENKVYVHPFDDEKIIEGQATVGLEIINQATVPIDYLILPIGGGGLAAGVSEVFRQKSPNTIIIGVEPEGAPSMKTSLDKGKNTTLAQIDKFVDGASVKRVGDRNFAICKQNLHRMIVLPEGKICQTILSLYNKSAMVVEPAGAMSIAAMSFLKEEIKGKNVVCVVSGGNSDITRTEEIRERALLYAGLKHYFIIRFPQRAGALREFVDQVLGPNDDITHFEYTKKHNREIGPALVGVEIKHKADFEPLVSRMKALNFFGEYLNEKPDLFQLLI